jgi:hypothetical protein
MDRQLLAIAALLALFSLAGCTNPALPAECRAFVKTGLQEQCGYEAAVLAQSPSDCYAISNLTLREACLTDSNNPDAMASVEEKRAARNLVPDNPVETGGNAPELPQKAPANAVDVCMETQKLSSDACTRAVAIKTGDITMCEQISAGEYRESCIANIAITRKKMADCNLLTNPTDKQLCASYSGG